MDRETRERHVRRGRPRRCNEGLASLCGIAGRRRVPRMIAGKLRAQKMPLHREDALSLLCLALGNRTGRCQCPVRRTLRHVEQHERQKYEEPRQDRGRACHALFCLTLPWRVCHPCAAQT